MSTENKIDLKSLSPDALKELKAEVAKEEKEKILNQLSDTPKTPTKELTEEETEKK